jgi:hypothetical protein
MPEEQPEEDFYPPEEGITDIIDALNNFANSPAGLNWLEAFRSRGDAKEKKIITWNIMVLTGGFLFFIAVGLSAFLKIISPDVTAALMGGIVGYLFGNRRN